jgi:hypothetical protein
MNLNDDVKQQSPIKHVLGQTTSFEPLYEFSNFSLDLVASPGNQKEKVMTYKKKLHAKKYFFVWEMRWLVRLLQLLAHFERQPTDKLRVKYHVNRLGTLELEMVTFEDRHRKAS